VAVAYVGVSSGGFRLRRAAVFLPEKTVEHRLSRIHAKLGVRSRAELAARLAR
jgi:Bacterial regulatory proteins, luxR family